MSQYSTHPAQPGTQPRPLLRRAWHRLDRGIHITCVGLLMLAAGLCLCYLCFARLSVVPDYLGGLLVVDTNTEFRLREGTEWAAILMSPSAAQNVRNGGTAWLNAQAASRPDSPRYPVPQHWHPTPIPITGHWRGGTETPLPCGQQLLVLCRLYPEGFDMWLNKDEVRIAEQAMSSPGSYYTDFGNASLLVVPDRQRIFWFYTDN